MDKAVQKLLKERYYLENENTWEDIAGRVSLIYPPIFEYIKDKLFIPSTPTLQNANTNGERAGTLSSCFTMGIKDSLVEIFDADKEAGLVTKAGGGVGYVFSSLRSSKEKITSLNAYSSGPVPFIRKFNATLDSIRQGGKRLGAGMAQLDVWHPDILNFIRLKKTKGECERFNFSVRIDDEFYAKLKENPNSPHLVKLKNGSYIPLEDNGKIVTIKEVWNEIVYYAWDNAEPGIFNISIAERQCTVKGEDDQVLSNPCQEYVNIPYSSCNLGSINAAKFVNEDGTFKWTDFAIAVREATRFLNSVIDVNEYPIPKIKEVTLNVRPIGLGIMGFAHCLFLMGIPFNSKEADAFTDELFSSLTFFSMSESIEIAKKTKKSYPLFNYDKYVKANSRFFERKDSIGENFRSLLPMLKKSGAANSCNTSIAPNGSISYIAHSTGGCEPLFLLSFARKIEKQNKEYEIVYINDPVFDSYLNKNYTDDEKSKILEYVSSNNGSCQGCDLMPEKDQKVFVTASDLTPMEHLHNLGIVARNTSLSVSKTINMPADATKEQVAEVYIKAQELGIIGVTVYRDGCRDGILISTDEAKSIEAKGASVTTDVPKITQRPRSIDGKIYQIPEANGRHTYCTIGHVDENGTKLPWEMFLASSGDKAEEYAAIGRLASRLMRKTKDVQGVIDELREVGGSNGYLTKEYGYVNSRVHHLSFILQEYIDGLNGKEKKVEYSKCPKCGEMTYIREGGCTKCLSCSHTSCG